MIRKITDTFYVSDRQITPEDLPEIADLQILRILCNRPDGEVENQPDFSAIQKQAKKYGIEATHIPIASGQFSSQAIEAFSRSLDDSQTPVLAYCRTGTRSTILWALSQRAAGRPLEAIISAAQSAGYDIADIVR